MGLSRQEYWSGLPFPPPGDLLDPGIEPTSPGVPALAGGFFITERPGNPSKLGEKDIKKERKEERSCLLEAETSEEAALQGARGRGGVE